MNRGKNFVILDILRCLEIPFLPEIFVKSRKFNLIYAILIKSRFLNLVQSRIFGNFAQKSSFKYHDINIKSVRVLLTNKWL